VLRERRLAVERPAAVLDAAEERHLLRGAEDRAVNLALVAVQISAVLENAAAVGVLADEGANLGGRIPTRAGAAVAVQIPQQTGVQSEVLNKRRHRAERRLNTCGSDDIPTATGVRHELTEAESNTLVFVYSAVSTAYDWNEIDFWKHENNQMK